MILERTFVRLAIALSTLGALGCGMEAVPTGEPSAAGTPATGGRPAAADAGAAAPATGNATGSETTTSVIVGADGGSTADAGGLASCTRKGATCAVTSDCCAGLSCTGEDENRRCN